MDGYSYAIRDVGGEKVHLSRAKSYGRPFGTGDVIGCLISLPSRSDDLVHTRRKRTPIRYKGQMYFEADEYAVQKEMEALVDREGKGALAAKAAAEAAKESSVEEKGGGGTGKKGATTKNAKKSKTAREPVGPVTRTLTTLDDSRIEFFLNGDSLGTAFTDLYDFTPLPAFAPIALPGHKRHQESVKEMLHDDGTLGYYPMISCFGKCKVRANFGPDWLFPPAGLVARPMSERWDEWRDEERILDERDEEDNTVRLKKEMAEDEVRRRVAETRLAGGGGALAKKKGKAAAPKRKKGGDGTPGPAMEGAMNTTPGPRGVSVSTPGLEEMVISSPAFQGQVKMEPENDGRLHRGAGGCRSGRCRTSRWRRATRWAVKQVGPRA